jgi:hypothetical protein
MRTLPTNLLPDAASILRDKTAEFHSLGLVLGYSYAGSPVVQPGHARPDLDPVTFTPTTEPGVRLPHTWLPDGSSLFDHLGRSLTLLGPLAAFSDDVAAFVAHATALGIPLTILEAPENYPWHDEFLLVRPDQHIAWRARTPREIDLAHVTGRAPVHPRPEGATTP